MNAERVLLAGGADCALKAAHARREHVSLPSVSCASTCRSGSPSSMRRIATASLRTMSSSRRWDFTLATESSSKSGRAGDGPTSSHLPKPPGLVEQADALALPSSAALTKNRADMEKLKAKKAWEVAVSPASQFAMNGFMLWMSGNQPNIFSIMITSYVMYNPIKAIFGAAQTFARFAEGQTDVTLQKVVFILINAAVCGFGVLKMSWLGLLPTEPADWIAFYSVRAAAESATGGTPLGSH